MIKLVRIKHPHPRERVYRQHPMHWAIKDTNSNEILSQLQHHVPNQNTAIVFDLDGTLFDVSHRTLGIVLSWAEQADVGHYDAVTVSKIKQMHTDDIGYSLANTFENMGLDIHASHIKNIYTDLQNHWQHRFFDGTTLLDFDQIYPNAASFVKKIVSFGITPVYLTGRYAHRMTLGTIQQIERAGLPFEMGNVYLKQNPSQDDAVFKMQALQTIASRFQVLANFENEYVNIDGMIDAAPTAMHIIFDSQHSGRDVRAHGRNIYRLASWD